MSEVVKHPYRAKRKRAPQTEWLSSLTLDEVERRLPKSGGDGFFACERKWLSENCVFDTIREKLAKEIRDRSEAIKERNATNKAIKEGRIEKSAEAVQALKQTTPGEVRTAALRTCELYLSSPVPRTLKQCICIAASEHMVSFTGIQAYLAGVGARTLWAEVEE